MTNAIAQLLEVATPQHGLFTVAQADEAGIGAANLRNMAARGTLERRAHGVYRIPQVPIDEHTELMEAVLWAKGRGTIAGETALLLWDFADVNPRKIHLTVPPKYRPRRQGGELYCVHHADLGPADRDEVDGVPVANPETAIRQAITYGVDGDLVAQAIRRAQAREFIGGLTAARLLVELEDRAVRRHTRG